MALRRDAGQRYSIALAGQSSRSEAVAVTHNPDSQRALGKDARLVLRSLDSRHMRYTVQKLL